MTRLLIGAIGLTLVVLAAASTSTAQSDEDWTVEASDDRRQEIIRRYQRILERRPVEGAVFERLVRELRGARGLERLIEEYEGRVREAPQQANLVILLGHLYKRASRLSEAADAYERAVALDPSNPLPIRARAAALVLEGRPDEAAQAYEQALAVAGRDDDRQEILFALADLALGNRELETAVGYLEQAAALTPRDVYVREQLADVLLEHGVYDRAIAQYEAILALTGRDTRQRAMTLGAIGDALVLQGSLDSAVERYREGQRLVRRGSWLHNDLERRIVDAYRSGGDLEALVAFYEARWSRPDFEQTRILVELYEELGRDDEALAMAERAVRANRRAVDARLDLIRLLERRNDMEAVVAAYEALIRLSDEPEHGFRLAEIHRQQGDEGAALEALAGLERMYRRRPGVLLQLAERYIRWGYRDRARALYHRLTEIEPELPEHWVVLGDLYFMEGQREQAFAIWEEIPRAVEDAATANGILGRVYANHGLLEQAIEFLQRAAALAPESRVWPTALGEALEQASRYDEALALWHRLAATASDPEEAASARRRVVGVYERQGQLSERIQVLADEFAQSRERATGFLLAEAHLRAGQLPAAEIALLQLLEADASDIRTLRALAAIYEDQNRLEEAIALLEQLAELEPDAARYDFDDIIRLSLRRFDVARALEFANRTVDLNRNDARGYERLAQIHRQTRRLERAAAAYEEAFRLDPRRTEYAYALGDLYAALRRTGEADRQFRRVVAQSRDESEILRAGRRAIQINQARGQLEGLIGEWGRLVHRPRLAGTMRRLYLEALGAYLQPLVRARQSAGWESGGPLEAPLASSGDRLFRPLIAVLADADGELRQAAVVLLSRLPSTDDADAALTALLYDEESAVRATAAIALGRLGVGPAAQALVEATSDPHSRVRAAAAWSLGQLADPSLIDPLLTALAGDADPEVRAVAALALGWVGDPRAVDSLLAALSDDESIIRQSAIWALGALRDSRAIDGLTVAVAEQDPREQHLAAWSLAQMGEQPAVLAALLRAYAMADGAVQAAAGLALRRLASDRRYPFREALSGWPGPEREVVPAELLETFIDGVSALGHEGGWRLIDGSSDVLYDVSSDLLSSPNREVVSRVLREIGDGGWAFGLGARGWAEPGPNRRVAQALASLSQRLQADVALQLGAGNSQQRALAARALGALAAASRESIAGQVALRGLLQDSSPEVRRQAVRALGRLGDADSAAVIESLSGRGPCGVRAAAAEALGRLQTGMPGPLLIGLVRADCLTVRAGAALGLAENGTREALSALGEALQQADAETRREVQRTLFAIPGLAPRVLETIGRPSD